MELSNIEQIIDHEDFGILDYDELVQKNAFSIEKNKSEPVPTLDTIWNVDKSVKWNRAKTLAEIKRIREDRIVKKKQSRYVKQLERKAMIKAFSTDYQLSITRVTNVYTYAYKEGIMYGTEEVRYLLHEILNTFYEINNLSDKSTYQKYIMSNDTTNIKEIRDLVAKISSPMYDVYSLNKLMVVKEFDLETQINKMLPDKNIIWNELESVRWNKERTQQITNKIKDQYLSTGILEQELNILHEKAIIQAFAFDHSMSCVQMEIAYKFAYREGSYLNMGEVIRILKDFLRLYRILR